MHDFHVVNLLTPVLSHSSFPADMIQRVGSKIISTLRLWAHTAWVIYPTGFPFPFTCSFWQYCFSPSLSRRVSLPLSRPHTSVISSIRKPLSLSFIHSPNRLPCTQSSLSFFYKYSTLCSRSVLLSLSYLHTLLLVWAAACVTISSFLCTVSHFLCGVTLWPQAFSFHFFVFFILTYSASMLSYLTTCIAPANLPHTFDCVSTFHRTALNSSSLVEFTVVRFPPCKCFLVINGFPFTIKPSSRPPDFELYDFHPYCEMNRRFL